MKAVESNLLVLLKKSDRFVVPIYQRVYSWEESECERLWQDIVRAGSEGQLTDHFTGSIVYIERDHGSNTSREPDLIIDGQQRLTTVALLLAALAERLEKTPEASREPVPGFSPQKIRGHYLTNPFESGDESFKLTLSKGDKDALRAVIRGVSLPETDSRIVPNYEFFREKLRSAEMEEITQVCRGLDKLVVVDVKLTRGVDDPQLVFESMNATGKRLSQADLIRNFVLMAQPQAKQENLYEDYWYPMEQRFKGDNAKRFDDFVRHFLMSQTGKIPRKDSIYEAFKEFVVSQSAEGVSHDETVAVLSKNAEWFASMAFGAESNYDLARRFQEIDQLAGVAYPFQLRLYEDYQAGVLSVEEFAEILDTVISYVFRRFVCRIPTNSLSQIFATLADAIKVDRYTESVAARLLTLKSSRRFPSDEEFKEALKTTDMYNSRTRVYFFRKMENHERKEEVSIADYSTEHIMPKNATKAWQESLGENWQEDHERYLHTLGNLTLTGYNSEYSNRPFTDKRDMEGGFRDSPLRLNQGLATLDTWNAEAIRRRAEELATEALEIWRRPNFSAEKLAEFRGGLGGAESFDWSVAHAILDALPTGYWTSYHHLAEAVGTGAQAMATHIGRCRNCTNGYRVLTRDGKVAPNFSWVAPDDKRDPVEVLRNEGIVIKNGRADSERKLTPEDLLGLIGEDDL